MMRSLPALILLLTLAACTQPEPRIEMAPDTGMGVQEAPAMAPEAAPCAPGEGDGIGGTGCAID